MTDVVPKDIADIKVELAKISGILDSLKESDRNAQAAADHRHNNIMTAIQNFVPRRELEIEFSKCATRADGLSKRIDDLEADRKKIGWAVITSAISGIVAIGGIVLKKLGLFV